jgi:pyruvate dehydrogenase E2 component (dihydrolipoamide acetyltransferase)
MKIQMPRLGETIVEGTILKWLKAEGESVEQDEPLFEISTDKVDTEVPSPMAGVLTKILVAEGATVPVGTELAEIEGAGGADAGKEVAKAPAEPSGDGQIQESAEAAPAEATAPLLEMAGSHGSAPGRPDLRVGGGPRSQILSPLVRKLASENSVNLALVVGTGTGGRITKTDVLAAAAAGTAAGTVPEAPPDSGTDGAPAAAAPGRAEAPVAVALVEATAPPAAVAGIGEEVAPISHIRKAIGTHMHNSLQTTARAWTMVEVDVEHLVRLREQAKDAFFRRYGVKLTYLPMVTRATAEALIQFPMVNAELRGDDLVERKFVNMGIAVSYDEGLIVPVIKNADGMNVAGLARSIADLASRARSHSLQPDDVHGATFTITNPGPYGSILSVPIINLPNAAILSLDAIQKRPVVINDAIAIRSMVYISMSWDHRVIDGELATRFLVRVKDNLETWDFAEDLGL